IAVSRVGVRIYLSVGPGGGPPSDFQISGVTVRRVAGGRRVVSATVANTGGRAVDLSGTLTLSAGPGGLSSPAVPVTLGSTLAVGASERASAVLGRTVPAGRWTARFDLRGDGLERSGQAQIWVPAASATSPWAGRWYPVGIACGVVAGSALLTVGIRRRRLA
ncbi:MAG: peptidase, partial [Frankia sp.]